VGNLGSHFPRRIERFEVSEGGWHHHPKVRGLLYRLLGLCCPDGKQILSASDETLHLCNLASGKELRKFEGHTAFVFGGHFLPDGKQALSFSADQTARVWALTTGRELSKLNVGPNLSNIRDLAISPYGKRILIGVYRSNEARPTELASGKEIHRFTLAAPARCVVLARRPPRRERNVARVRLPVDDAGVI
jgi:WD40 repeat protein